MKSTIILFISFFVLIFWGCEDEPEDCTGVTNGEAYENEFGYCVGGNTGLPENFYGTITDTDGNVYNTVIIGNQVWMAENLKVTHYRDGTAIPTVHSNSEWSNLSTGAYTVFDNNESNADTYGYLYNWYAVDDSRNIAPDGWHVPTDYEWKTLEMALGMSQSEANGTGYRGTNEGSKLAGNADLWYTSNLENNTEFGTSGFTALPSGYRGWGGGYGGMGNYGFFWTASEYDDQMTVLHYAWYRALDHYYIEVRRFYGDKQNGRSVRCVRD